VWCARSASPITRGWIEFHEDRFSERPATPRPVSVRRVVPLWGANHAPTHELGLGASERLIGDSAVMQTLYLLAKVW